MKNGIGPRNTTMALLPAVPLLLSRCFAASPEEVPAEAAGTPDATSRSPALEVPAAVDAKERKRASRSVAEEEDGWD